MDVTEENRNLIDNLIVSANAGSEGAVRQLHHGLTQKLILVPVIRLDDAPEGTWPLLFDPYVEGMCTLCICDRDGQYVLPLFGSRQLFESWCALGGVEVEGLPLYAPDVARILPPGVTLILNPDSDFEYSLNSDLLLSAAHGAWLGSANGLYQELSLIEDINAAKEEIAKHVAEQQESLSQQFKTSEEYQEEVEMQEVTLSEEPNSLDVEIEAEPSSLDLELEEDSVPVDVDPKIQEPLEKKEVAPEPKILNPEPISQSVGRQRANTFCIGVDEINFKKEEFLESPESLEPVTSYSRERQGTFTKVLDVLKKYREKS